MKDFVGKVNTTTLNN